MGPFAPGFLIHDQCRIVLFQETKKALRGPVKEGKYIIFAIIIKSVRKTPAGAGRRPWYITSIISLPAAFKKVNM